MLLVGLLAGCEEDTETTWLQFNADDDAVQVVVGAAKVGSPESAELHSTSGAIVIGSFSVDPGSAPVGTDHLLEVTVADDYEELVDKVTLVADAGDRGAEEYELRQDSADHGHWWVEVTSSGDPKEVRTDIFTVLLWQEEATETTVWTAYTTTETD